MNSFYNQKVYYETIKEQEKAPERVFKDNRHLCDWCRKDPKEHEVVLNITPLAPIKIKVCGFCKCYKTSNGVFKYAEVLDENVIKSYQKKKVRELPPLPKDKSKSLTYFYED